MPDALDWLGVGRIDRLISMSDLKYDALIGQGIKIVERVSLPDHLVPSDAQVEIAAKKAAGYYTSEPAQLDGFTDTVGRTLDRSEEHTSELQSLRHLVCRLLLEKK